jgi:CheY-like chemotaxis protein
VLVVDDEHDSREVVAAHLENHHATVITAASAPEALDVLQRRPIDVLIAELGVLLIVALPIGAMIGLVMSRWLMSQFETDLFTFPYVTNAAAYARPALFVGAAVLVATLLVRRGVDRLDLVGVLKSRD